MTIYAILKTLLDANLLILHIFLHEAMSIRKIFDKVCNFKQLFLFLCQIFGHIVSYYSLICKVQY